MKTAILVLAVLGALCLTADAACPNQCSGHGRCGKEDVCTCFYRWTGDDCGQRLCKEGLAWVDGSQSDPHTWSECSNKGICDRETGECKCFDQYDGAACDRSVCPNDCSNHGTCEYIHELSTWAATNWDYAKIQGCKCDGGFTGPDCSKRMCPKGDDPLTIVPAGTDSLGDQYQIIFSDIAGAASATKFFYIEVVDLYGTTHRSRADDVVAIAALAELDAEARFADLLLDMPCFDSLDGTVTDVTVTAGPPQIVQFDFRLEAPLRVTSLKVVHGTKGCYEAGCYPHMTTQDANADLSTVSVAITQAVEDAAESAECSNRGDCDYSTGICQCYEGHFGLACERQTILV